MAIIGCHSYDEGFGDQGAGGAGYPWSAVGVLSPTRVDSGPQSRGGWRFSTGDGGSLQADFWDSPVSGKVWYYFPFEGVSQADAVNTSYNIAYFHYQTAAATGKVRAVWVYNTATTGHFRLEYHNGSAWTLIANGAAIALNDSGEPWYVRVEIDITPTTGRAAALSVNNGASGGLSGSTGTTDLIAGTLALLAGQLKGGGTLTWDAWEAFANDTSGSGAQSAAMDYTGLSSKVHCFGNYPVSDVAGGVWAAVGNVGACSGDVYRAVDDPEDTEDQAFDYAVITGASGSDKDQEFEISDQDHASAAIYGVSIYVEAGVPDSWVPHKILVAVPSESGSPTAYAGTQ
ncbi:hypothetical protein LCGC14_2127780, partial [marine sediment metagenome]